MDQAADRLKSSLISLARSGNLAGLRSIGEDIMQTGWSGTDPAEYADLVLTLCRGLAAGRFNDLPATHALLGTHVARAFDHPECFSLLEKIELLELLPIPSGILPELIDFWTDHQTRFATAWLEVWSEARSAVDPGFDPDLKPVRNPTSGPGTAPGSIRDPATRAKYETSLREFEEASLRYHLQIKLHRKFPEYQQRLEMFIAAAFKLPLPDRDSLEALFERLNVVEDLRTKLREAVYGREVAAWPPRPLEWRR